MKTTNKNIAIMNVNNVMNAGTTAGNGICMSSLT